MSSPPSGRTRSPRQRELIAVAARLFAYRGYHAVGINDITAELGLTGPAFYRHYKSKDELLIAVLDEAISSHLEEVRDIVSATPDSDEALDAIIAHHLAFVFDHSVNIVTWRLEFRSIPEYDRDRLRYLERLTTEEWVRTVKKLRPELGGEQVRAMCQATIAMLQSPTEFDSGVHREDLIPLLTSMASHVLRGTASRSTECNS